MAIQCRNECLRRRFASSADIAIEGSCRISRKYFKIQYADAGDFPISDKFASFAASYNEWGAWIVFGAGLTPFPYKVITIASGVTQLDLLVFVVASVIARGMRFFAVAGLLWWFGPPIRRFLERYLGAVTFAFFALLIGGFVALRYAF